MNITYQNLKELIASNSLREGESYTFEYHYVGKYPSGDHPFNLTVVATSSNTIDRTATASLLPGYSYFANSQMSSWVIYYDVDNYDWTSDYGTIYYLKDEFDNVAPFDFKNVKIDDQYLFSDINGDDMSVTQLQLCRDNRLPDKLNSLTTIHLEQRQADNEIKYNNIFSGNTNISISGEFNTIFEDCSNITIIGDHNTIKKINSTVTINGSGNTLNDNNSHITITGDDNKLENSEDVTIIGDTNVTEDSTIVDIIGDSNTVTGSNDSTVRGDNNNVTDSTTTIINGNNNNVDNSTSTTISGDDNTTSSSSNTTIANGNGNTVTGSTNTNINDSNNTTISNSNDITGNIPDGGKVDGGILDGDINLNDPTIPVVKPGYIDDAPQDNIIYGRQNSAWTPVPIQSDAPIGPRTYVRQNGAWVSAQDLKAGTNITITDNKINAVGYIYDPTTNTFKYGSRDGENAISNSVTCSSVIAGKYNSVNSSYATAAGLGCIVKGDCQVVIGSHNIPSDTDAFIVGGGTSEADQSNIFTIQKNGTTVQTGPVVAPRIQMSAYGPYPIPQKGWYTIVSNIRTGDTGIVSVYRGYKYYGPEGYSFTYSVGYGMQTNNISLVQQSGFFTPNTKKFIDKFRIYPTDNPLYYNLDIHINELPYQDDPKNAESIYVQTILGAGFGGTPILNNNNPTVVVEQPARAIQSFINTTTNDSQIPYEIQTITADKYQNLTNKDKNTLYFVV